MTELATHTGFKTADAALDFIFGGNAVFTIQSGKTGDHFTFKAKQPKDDNPQTPTFFSVLNGPDNWENYMYIGFTNALGGHHSGLRAGRKGHPEAPSFKALTWTLTQLKRGGIPADLTIQHEGKCCRCARRLTHPDSIAAGIGPECATK